MALLVVPHAWCAFQMASPLLVTLLMACLATCSPVSPRSTDAPHTSFNRKPKLADGCRDVYIDLGTNVGVQIRKIFEPQLYPGGAVLPRFDKYFGTKRSNVCVFGFEPNPVHMNVLKQLQDTYRALVCPSCTCQSRFSHMASRFFFVRGTV